MGYNAHDVLEKVVAYYTSKHEIKKNKIWLWFQIGIIFKNKTLKLQGINTFSKIHIYSKVINKKHVMFLDNYKHLL